MNQHLIDRVRSKFSEDFGAEPLLIFSPGRINIIGEHTDYNEGFVFPAAIDKGIVAAFSKSNSNYATVYAIDKEERVDFQLNQLRPATAGSWQNYVLGVVAELQKKACDIENFNLAFSGDIPGGAGMSSSAALENSVVYGLNVLFDLGLSKAEMIFISQKAEHNYVGVHCGIMDQYASMFGIQDHAFHLDCQTIEAEPYKIELGDYQLLLINTNVHHTLSDSAYNNRREVCEHVSQLLDIPSLRHASEALLKTIKDRISDEDYQKALFVIQENHRTIQASKAITDGDLHKLGALIYASHDGLQKQYNVSCAELDFLVDATRLNPHILGARMMGGGFGGCTINLIKKTEVASFSSYIQDAYHQKFNVACSIYDINLSDGTHQL